MHSVASAFSRNGTGQILFERGKEVSKNNKAVEAMNGVTFRSMSLRISSLGVSKRIPELDGLRGLAILLVLVCHYVGNVSHGDMHSWTLRFGSFLEQGTVGVDLFFVLSGFLIGGILLGSRASLHYYRTFYLRRFHRIIPLYYSWVILFGLIWIISSKWSGQIWATSWPGTGYWIHFVFLQNYIHQTNQMQFIWLGALWSLAVEEQFYLVAPPLVRNLSPRRLTILMIGTVPFCLILRFFLSREYGPSHNYWGKYAAYSWTPCRADDLALGILFAIIWANPDARRWIKDNSRIVYAGLIACAVLLVPVELMISKPDSYLAASSGRTLIGIFFVLTMVSILSRPEQILGRVFRLVALRELGKVSYCIYIIHGAIHTLVFKVAGFDFPRFNSWLSVALVALAFGITMGVAEFSWKYFEHPLIRRGHRYSY
jgi:peptidoglycan/LPS O-acetylase OafA/YrhL